MIGGFRARASERERREREKEEEARWGPKERERERERARGSPEPFTSLKRWKAKVRRSFSNTAFSKKSFCFGSLTLTRAPCRSLARASSSSPRGSENSKISSPLPAKNSPFLAPREAQERRAKRGGNRRSFPGEGRFGEEKEEGKKKTRARDDGNRSRFAPRRRPRPRSTQ